MRSRRRTRVFDSEISSSEPAAAPVPDRYVTLYIVSHTAHVFLKNRIAWELVYVPAQIVPKTRTFKRTRWHDIVSDVFKDSQYASRTFKDKMVVAKRLYAQEKREGRAADRNQADREETQARSTQRMTALNRVGSMRRRPPPPNE
eukprot:COSAG01_NODE_3775_length_5710_cov_6.461059_1_plen_144_part_10